MPPAMRIVVELVLAWIVAISLLAACHAGKRDEVVTPRPRMESEVAAELLPIAGIDASQMTEHEQATLATLLSEQLSPCGDPVELAQCASSARKCGACVPAARYLARLVMEGYEPQTIAEHYRGRFAGEPLKASALERGGVPVRGAAMAPITIVEFSDFQCPYCGQAHPVLIQALAQMDSRVKLVFRHFPLPGHARAMPAARAAEAARLQGKFWEMHDLLFERQSRLEDRDLTGYAQQLGLDVQQFKRDMASAAVAERVDADRAAGRSVGVDSTPTLFVNGRLFRETPRTLLAYLKEEAEL